MQCCAVQLHVPSQVLTQVLFMVCSRYVPSEHAAAVGSMEPGKRYLPVAELKP